MKLVKVFIASSLLFGSLFASEFISYDDLSKKLKEEIEHQKNKSWFERIFNK